MKIIESVMDFTDELPEPFDVIAFTAITVISALLIASAVIVIPILILMEIGDASARETCLDSQTARRYKSFVCEEYHDGRWVEIDPGDVYYYNSAAAQD